MTLHLHAIEPPDGLSRVGYSMTLKRYNADGSVSVVAHSGYDLLHELLEVIIQRANSEGWLLIPEEHHVAVVGT